jgi:hypothetical protein
VNIANAAITFAGAKQGVIYCLFTIPTNLALEVGGIRYATFDLDSFLSYLFPLCLLCLFSLDGRCVFDVYIGWLGFSPQILNQKFQTSHLYRIPLMEQLLTTEDIAVLAVAHNYVHLLIR